MDIKSNTVKIAYLTDNTYIMPTVVSIISAIKNKAPDSFYKIYILTTSDEKIFNQIEHDKSTQIIVKNINLDDYIKENINERSHVSKTALLKFFIAEILEEDKILYIDSDTIIQKDLKKMYSTELEQKYAAVVSSPLSLNINHTQNLGIESCEYFNSGVLLLNLLKMREDNIAKKLLDYKLNNYNLFMDQDAFNKIFNKCVKYLPIEYNQYMPKKFLPRRFKTNLKKAYIIHFTDRFKPWLYKRRFITNLFIKYYKLSPYKKEKLNLKEYESKFILLLIKHAILGYII